VNYSLHPEADEEFAGAVRYYSEISPELGVRFYREVERLFQEFAPARNAFANSIRLPADISAAISPMPSSFWKSPIASGLSP